jgi:hypothetical protein
MSVFNKTVKDKETILFNPITGKLDMALKFNPDRIVTNERNSAGTMLMTYEMSSGLFIMMDPVVVTDNNGNVVVVG